MAILKISYQDELFAMNDIFKEIIMQMVCETMEESELSGYSRNARDFYGYCDLIRRGKIKGSTEFCLDSWVSNVDQMLELNDIFGRTIERLSASGEWISKEVLEQLDAHSGDIDPLFRDTDPL